MSLARPVVLVVEDDAGTWNLLRDLLDPAGYAVESAPDGAVDQLAAQLQASVHGCQSSAPAEP